MKNRKVLRALVFFAGFIFALLLFFPLNHFKGQVLGMLQAQTGMRITSKEVSMGTGLGLGLARGGILAFHFDDFQLVTSSGQKLQCQEASLSPHLWTFFIGQLQLGLRCIEKKEGQLLAKIEITPIWNPATMDVFVTLDDLSMSILNGLFPNSGSYSGRLNGTLSATKIQLQRPDQIPRIEWQLEGQDVAFPALSSPLMSLPSLKLGPLKTQGSLRLPRLNVEKFDFGNDSSPLKGSWSIVFDLGQNMLPLKGEWKGTLRADSDFQRSGIGGYKLEQLFGPQKEGGVHEFRKVLREGESLLGLLSGS